MYDSRCRIRDIRNMLYMIDTFPPLFDLDHRFRIMDKYEGLVQVIAPSWPSVELAAPEKAVDLSKVLNDEIADEL